MKPNLPIYVHRRRPLRRRLWDALRDLPYIMAASIGDDADPAFLRRVQRAVFLMFGLAVALWLLGWWLR